LPRGSLDQALVALRLNCLDEDMALRIEHRSAAGESSQSCLRQHLGLSSSAAW